MSSATMYQLCNNTPLLASPDLLLILSLHLSPNLELFFSLSLFIAALSEQGVEAHTCVVIIQCGTYSAFQAPNPSTKKVKHLLRH